MFQVNSYEKIVVHNWVFMLNLGLNLSSLSRNNYSVVKKVHMYDMKDMKIENGW